MVGFGSNLVMLEIAPLRQVGLEERLFTLSSVGTNVSYDVFGFHVSADGRYSMESTSFSPSGSDTCFLLYQNAFDPDPALSKLLQVDDDSGVDALSRFTRSLQADIQYYLVFTTYNNGDSGAYTVCSIPSLATARSSSTCPARPVKWRSRPRWPCCRSHWRA